MLTSLRIQNLALVEDLEWTLSSGFVAVTGETGSGKSIIIGALKLLLGERADKSLIRTGSDSCTVEAVFQIPNVRDLNKEFEEFGIEACDGSELILKRVFSHTGTNRQFINCSATTLAVLKQIGDSLVDLHGPHDHQSLLSADKQQELLDAFAGAEEVLAAYRKVYRELAGLRSEFDELSNSEAALEREIDLLRHQVNEIESADLNVGEEESLTNRYAVAKNGKRLTELSSRIVQLLSEADDAVLIRLNEAQRLFRDLEKIDSTVTNSAESFSNAVIELEEVARSVQQYADHLESDPEQLARMEERITTLEGLKRKYGSTLEKVIAYGDDAADRLKKIEGRGEELRRLEREIQDAESVLKEWGRKLSQKRKGAAPKLAKAVTEQLRELGFKKSEFEVSLASLEKPNLQGMESVEFLFAPNPGEPPKPLKAIASSGEASRVMLAVKGVLAAQDKVALLVFDEIDANVGGEIAHAVAAKMRALGEEHQVLCITHLPQVAAAANTQFVVTKDYNNGRTISRIDEVKGKGRIEEVARMLGGKGDSALSHAKTLLNQ